VPACIFGINSQLGAIWAILAVLSFGELELDHPATAIIAYQPLVASIGTWDLAQFPIQEIKQSS
jgi:hypothetical protein